MNIILLKLNSAEIEDASEVSSYLNSGRVFLAAAGLEQDAKDPSKGDVVPIGWATDGENVWPLSLTYYVDNYCLGLDEEFLAIIRANNYQCPTVDENQLSSIQKEFNDSNSQSTESSQTDPGEPNSNPFI